MAKGQYTKLVELYSNLIDLQKRSIDECGGDILGYIARYGDPGRNTIDGKPMYGDGGTAIYNADMEALSRYHRLLEEAISKQR